MSEIINRIKGIRDRRRQESARRNIGEAGFWFVDIPRTGSTSLKIQLGEKVIEGFGKSGGRVRKIVSEPFFPDHTSGGQVRQVLGEQLWDSIFTFSIVRNPWARFFSMYKYRKATDMKTGDVSFDDYLRMLDNFEVWSRAAPFWMTIFYWPMAAYVCDGHGKLLVNEVYKFENYPAAIEDISTRLNVELDSGVVENTLTGNTDYREQYSDYGRDVIARVYKKDIELFEYEF